jgi:DNA (cytosine-5)-methyltransferase 1
VLTGPIFQSGWITLQFLSVCSGIEAASVAWEPLGWRAAALAEIEPFPCHVLAHRQRACRPMFMPDPANATDVRAERERKAALKAVHRLPVPSPDLVPNFGDLTRFKEWPYATIDLLVGGTPCQSFSVAGLRNGLDDPRGNLALTYLAVADRYRPRWVVWENVPGVLSSNKGRDFGAFLGGLGQLGYGWAYRVLDAQFIRTRGLPGAVPQRRRRVFVVGYLGDWRPATAVLFDRQSMRGDPPPRRQAGERIASTISSRTTGGGGLGTDFEVDGGLIPEICNALAARDAKLPRAEDNVGIIPVSHLPVAFDLRGREEGAIPEGPHDTANIRAASGGSSRSYVAHPWAVRRLTPLECERLQGFPDGYTLVPYRGKPAADSPRYKALGNSMAVNAMQWIGERIAFVEDILQSSHDQVARSSQRPRHPAPPRATLPVRLDDMLLFGNSAVQRNTK